MGCHVWFYRPMTNDELLEMKQNAMSDAADIFLYMLDIGEITRSQFEYKMNEVCHSVETDAKCILNKYSWKELGYGWNPEQHNQASCKYFEGSMYVDVIDYHDCCRCITTYPKKVIHSFKQYKRYVRKKWYDIPKREKDMLREFFLIYPQGIIAFG